MTIRDFQKSKVYAWERAFVFPKMPSATSDIETMRVLGAYMWEGLGQENPPQMHIDLKLSVHSTGARHQILFEKTMTDERVLAHELAHSYNNCAHRTGYDHHGPNYVADYCQILIKFYGFDAAYLLYTLKKAKVKVNEGRVYG